MLLLLLVFDYIQYTREKLFKVQTTVHEIKFEDEQRRCNNVITVVYRTINARKLHGFNEKIFEFQTVIAS